MANFLSITNNSLILLELIRSAEAEKWEPDFSSFVMQGEKLSSLAYQVASLSKGALENIALVFAKGFHPVTCISFELVHVGVKIFFKGSVLDQGFYWISEKVSRLSRSVILFIGVTFFCLGQLEATSAIFLAFSIDRLISINTEGYAKKVQEIFFYLVQGISLAGTFYFGSYFDKAFHLFSLAPILKIPILPLHHRIGKLVRGFCENVNQNDPGLRLPTLEEIDAPFRKDLREFSWNLELNPSYDNQSEFVDDEQELFNRIQEIKEKILNAVVDKFCADEFIKFFKNEMKRLLKRSFFPMEKREKLSYSILDIILLESLCLDLRKTLWESYDRELVRYMRENKEQISKPYLFVRGVYQIKN